MKLKKAPEVIFQTIAEEAMMAFLLISPNRQVVYANKMAHSLFEFSMSQDADAIGVDQFFATSNFDRRIRGLNEETLEMQGLMQEVLVTKLNGQTFLATVGIKHIVIDSARHYLLMIQDVTLQKKLQREISEKQGAIQQAYQDLLRQNQQLKTLDVAKDRFVSMTTHELRTPASAMLASAEILKNKLYDNEAQHDEFVDMLFQQGGQLLALINDILDFAKIQADRMDYYIESKNIAELLTDQIDALKPVANNANIELVPFTANQPFDCYFDEVRMRQVVSNIVSNAIKYNKPNGKVSVEIKSTDDFVEVHIIDTGTGIAEEHFSKLFVEFETLGKIGNHSKGTGLGLTISQKMIRRMGGDIFLKSELGKGSTFWVTIPRHRVLDETDYRSRQVDDFAA